MQIITRIPKLEFSGYAYTDLLLYKSQYVYPSEPPQTALTLQEEDEAQNGDYYPIAIVTTNLSGSGYVAPPNTFYVKNYSENEGIQDALIDLGIIEIVEGSEPAFFGYNNSVRADLCQLTEQYR